ncbi:MAG: hypothetical protein MUF45_09800 [Spirosomaceae bacterium]|nr:hypothetical protein [Spirosomataceae bacterium]
MQLLQRRDIGDKIRATVDFIKENFKSLMLSSLIFAIPLGVTLGYFMSKYQLMVNQLVQEAQDDPANANPFELFSQLFDNTTLAMLVLSQFLSVMLMTAIFSYIEIYEERESSNISVSEVLNRTFSNLPRVLLTYITIMFLFAIIMIILVLGLTPVMSSIKGGADGATGLRILSIMMIVFGIIMLLLLLFVGVGIYLSLSPIVASREKASPIEAIRTSYNLIKGEWWLTFGFLVIMIILQSLISTIISIPLSVMSGVSAVSPEAIDEPKTLIISSVTYILSSLVGIIYYVGVALQYYDLKARG